MYYVGPKIIPKPDPSTIGSFSSG